MPTHHSLINQRFTQLVTPNAVHDWRITVTRPCYFIDFCILNWKYAVEARIHCIMTHKIRCLHYLSKKQKRPSQPKNHGKFLSNKCRRKQMTTTFVPRIRPLIHTFSLALPRRLCHTKPLQLCFHTAATRTQCKATSSAPFARLPQPQQTTYCPSPVRKLYPPNFLHP